MPARNPPKLFSLLVGIDLYLSGERKGEKGKHIHIDNLQGCVNDVRNIERFLREDTAQRFQVMNPSVLTSSVDQNHTEPSEPLECWPTFANIKKEFDNVEKQASPGDFFFFQFSGHGALLPKVSCSPSKTQCDPCLLTVDYLREQRAVRGWEINQWLKKLNEQKIQIVVVIDSCYAGGGWRSGGSGDRWRSPEGLATVPNLPIDDDATIATPVMSNSRDGELDVSWSINPKGFTLMAACKGDEKAFEITINGKAGGAFTCGLLESLKPLQRSKQSEVDLTYRALRDHIAQQLTGSDQTPRVFGQDRLLFLGSQEPFFPTRLVVKVDKDEVSLPIGKVHGIQEGCEFTTIAPASEVTFQIDKAEEDKCSATVPPHILQILQKSVCEVVPSRWSLGKDPLRILVDASLGSEFQVALYESLQRRIFGSIQVINDEVRRPDPDTLRLTKGNTDGSIDIFGPQSLIGYKSAVRGLNLSGDNIEDIAAIVLSHLTRFRQILRLSEQASKAEKPFNLTWDPEPNINGKEPFQEHQQFKLTVANKGNDPLHFTVLGLSPGFHVKQAYPSSEHPQKVEPDEENSFSLTIRIPDELRTVQTTDGRPIHRDILRTIITIGSELSWKILELPDIWNVSQCGGLIQWKRDVMPQDKGFSWWVVDREVSTCTHSV
ncbi:caspase domain-containing protein [Ilyonectria sp. MPI-CAGE-AT-0026]|nr:caspase domain-containing protein [Ilyonectria sp. MPI-CAGE-AT-0026]